MPYSFAKFLKDFPNADTCLEYLFNTKHANTKCPECGRVGKLTRNKSLAGYQCHCGRFLLYPRKGTLFENSKIDLQKWFLAILLLSESRMTVRELSDALEISKPIAWKVQQKLMKIMAENVKNTDFLKGGNASIGGGNFNEESRHLYVASDVFRKEKTGEEPFRRLLNLAMNV